MGIAVDFLIKHVRPIDDGVELMCGDEMRKALTHLGMSKTDIDGVFKLWSETAQLDPRTPRFDLAFARSAWLISQARWSDLYPTNKSTIMFLNAPLLKELSLFCEKKKGQNFTFDPYETIPIAITISQTGQNYSIVKGAKGFNGAADTKGLCVHFDSVVD